MKRSAIILAPLLCAVACASLLGLPSGPVGRPFEHRAHLLNGVGCPQCHAGISSAGDQGPLHLPSDARCVECHKLPHDPSPCSGCHGTTWAEERAKDAKAHLVFAHQSHLPRINNDCARCHTGVADDRAELLPPMGTCLGCHPHNDEFDARRCDPCHRNLVDEDARPQSHLVHGNDYSDRHGVDAASSRDLCESCHSQRFCAKCHGATVPALQSRRVFDRTDEPRLHQAGFRSRHAVEARSQPGTCTSCHSIESCSDCHRVKDVAATGTIRRGPHPPDWVGATSNTHGRAARLDPIACASCHSGSGEQLCVGCHKVGAVGGNPHPLGWSSKKRLSEEPCRRCHLGSPP